MAKLKLKIKKQECYISKLLIKLAIRLFLLFCLSIIIIFIFQLCIKLDFEKKHIYSNGFNNLYYCDYIYKYKSKNIIFDAKGIPIYYYNNNPYYHPIYIIQFGLGAYQLFLKTGDIKAKNDFIIISNWLLNNLKKYENGLYFWEYSGEIKPYEGCDYNNVWFSAMAQGQGASLLIRAFILTKDAEYLKAAYKALIAVKLDKSENGLSILKGEYFFPQEYPLIKGKPTDVLNGAIFAYLGLYDYYQISKDNETGLFCDKFIKTIKDKLIFYDTGFWSLYSLFPEGKLANPYYHELHISLLKTLHEITGIELFSNYASKWQKYYKNIINRIKYIIIYDLNHLKKFKLSKLKHIKNFIFN
jgi:hypothetical protein